jgi:regulator of protease activity HflC (stomatin/prohibitin superfamily)
MFRRILVGDTERVLVIRNRRFEKMLGPGVYWFLMVTGELSFESHSVRDPAFYSQWADFIAREHPATVEEYFVLVETGSSQVAVVYFDGRLARVIVPGTRVLFMRGPVKVTFDVIDVRAEPEVPRELVPAVAKLGREALASFQVVDEGKRGLLYLDGRFVRELPPGAYGFWTALSAPRVDVVEMRLQTLEVPGQEILTKDKVTVRVNVWAVFEVTDPALARATVKDVEQHLYRTLQIAVRQTLATRTLEEVLAEKVDIDASVSATVRRELEAYGVRVGEIALKDIILPGDIRDILNQVVTAEKQAQANLIRRREETAATRSLLNTARLMEENPLLVRLKELESLEKIAEKVEKITVVGGLDALLEQTVKLRSS